MLHSLETACLLPLLEGGLQGEPWKPSYEIGERITLSCPRGMHLEGARSILCEPSLKWTPDMKTIHCKKAVPSVKPEVTEPKCQPWEKVQQSQCVCKLPYECGPSLDICATDPRTERSIPLTVCKMYALECMGRKYSLTKAANCKAPQAAEKSCRSCRSWEKCEGERFFMILSEIVYMNEVKSISPFTQWQWPCAGAAPPTLQQHGAHTAAGQVQTIHPGFGVQVW
ncbi:UNVERIFIED_CONTAM: hypothetical protein H355_007021 [Colinus virginianus]|nr:hypothetical protein H355_007021 [Colinus virginianus]